MRYIKTFEEIDETGLYCWRITTKYPEYVVSLKKIGMDNSSFNDWKDMFEDDYQGYIYILKSVYKDGSCDWSWSTDEYSVSLGDAQRLKYMGDVDIDEVDIQSHKYNL